MSLILLNEMLACHMYFLPKVQKNSKPCLKLVNKEISRINKSFICHLGCLYELIRVDCYSKDLCILACGWLLLFKTIVLSFSDLAWVLALSQTKNWGTSANRGANSSHHPSSKARFWNFMAVLDKQNVALEKRSWNGHQTKHEWMDKPWLKILEYSPTKLTGCCNKYLKLVHNLPLVEKVINGDGC